MRIAFPNPIGQIGGAERSLLDMMASLRVAEPDWELHLIAGDNGPLAEEARALGVEAHVLRLPNVLGRLGDWGAQDRKASLLLRMGLASRTAAVYVASLRRLLHELSPDLVHTNGFKMHVLAAWGKPAGVPLIWHIRDYVSRRVAMALLLRIHAGRCAAAIANSWSVADDFRALCPKLRIHTIWNAIDLHRFSPDGPRLDLDAACGLPPAGSDIVRVGLMATMARWKGHKDFLGALAMISPKLPVRGYIIGGPLYRTPGSQWTLEQLKEIAQQFGLKGRVGFAGFVPRPEEALRALDVLVHASTQPEPFGRTVIEAMACGRPAIVSATGGVLEFTEPGRGVLAYRPGDVASLAACITQLATSESMRATLGRRGRRKAQEGFGRERLAARLVTIYRGIWKHSPRQRRLIARHSDRNIAGIKMPSQENS